MANAYVRMRHPDYDALRGMLDDVGAHRARVRVVTVDAAPRPDVAAPAVAARPAASSPSTGSGSAGRSGRRRRPFPGREPRCPSSRAPAARSSTGARPMRSRSCTGSSGCPSASRCAGCTAPTCGTSSSSCPRAPGSSTSSRSRRGEQRERINDPLNPRLAHSPLGSSSVCYARGYEVPGVDTAGSGVASTDHWPSSWCRAARCAGTAR